MFPDLAPQARLARGWIAQAASKSAYEGTIAPDAWPETRMAQVLPDIWFYLS